jgi:hypothetical protein
MSPSLIIEARSWVPGWGQGRRPGQHSGPAARSRYFDTGNFKLNFQCVQWPSQATTVMPPVTVTVIIISGDITVVSLASDSGGCGIMAASCQCGTGCQICIH